MRQIILCQRLPIGSMAGVAHCIDHDNGCDLNGVMMVKMLLLLGCYRIGPRLLAATIRNVRTHDAGGNFRRGCCVVPANSPASKRRLKSLKSAAAMYFRPAMRTVLSHPRRSHRQAVTGEAPVTSRKRAMLIGGTGSLSLREMLCMSDFQPPRLQVDWSEIPSHQIPPKELSRPWP
jgi:hypothetical protein